MSDDLDIEETRWEDLALCKGTDSEDFFKNYEESEIVARNTDQICLTCPVQPQCFFTGVERKETGVWGGFYLERGTIDTARNAHKTIEIERKLKRRLYDYTTK